MDKTPSAAGLTVVTVNGKNFVSGLKWKTLEHFRTYMAEARQYGKENQMEMVAIRRGQVLQAGFAPKSEHRLRGMYSLAAALAGQLGDNWIGIFALPNERYVFIAVHQGSVMIGRDLVTDRATAEAEFDETFNLLQSEGSWSETGKIVAPADWEFATENTTLEELLQPKLLKNEHRLRPLTMGLTRRELVLSAVAVAVIGAAGLGYMKWQSIQDARKTQRQTAAMIQLQQAQEEQAAKLAAEARKNIVRPWEQQPGVETMLDACAAFWSDTPLSVGGWVFTGGQCTAQNAKAVYRRPDAGTTVTQFADTVRERFKQQPGIFEAGESGSVEASIRLSPQVSDTLRLTAMALEGFTAHMQAAPGETTFTIEERPWQPPADTPDAIAPDWITQSFTIKTDISPAAVVAGLDTQGVRVSDVSVVLNPDAVALEWTITGEIYGR